MTQPVEFAWPSGRVSTAAAEAAQWLPDGEQLHSIASSPPQSAFKALPMPDFSSAVFNSQKKHEPLPTTKAMSPKLHGGRAASAPVRRQLPHHSIVEQERLAAIEEYKSACRRDVCC